MSAVLEHEHKGSGEGGDGGESVCMRGDEEEAANFNFYPPCLVGEPAPSHDRADVAGDHQVHQVDEPRVVHGRREADHKACPFMPRPSQDLVHGWIRERGRRTGGGIPERSSPPRRNGVREPDTNSLAYFCLQGLQGRFVMKTPLLHPKMVKKKLAQFGSGVGSLLKDAKVRDSSSWL